MSIYIYIYINEYINILICLSSVLTCVMSIWGDIYISVGGL